jgi:hypothetical protein
MTKIRYSLGIECRVHMGPLIIRVCKRGLHSSFRTDAGTN